MCDEIEYKLVSKNPVLVSHAISKLFDTVKKKCNEQREISISKVPEFKLLLSKCKDDDPVLSISACQALILLVENGLWDVNAALSTFMSSLASTQNYMAVSTTIGQLLIINTKLNKDDKNVYPFTLTVPQHPFIVILNQDKCSWQAVLSQTKSILNHQDRQVRETSVQMLRPVFLYTLCNPTADLSDSCKEKMWQYLIKSHNALEMQLEVLLWSCVNDANSCMDTSHRVLELSNIALLEKDKNRCTALLPILLSLTVQLIKHGCDPRSYLERVFVMLDQCSENAGNITLILMAELIMICPAVYLHNAVQTCTAIVNKMVCDDTVLNTLVASLLKWMPYPSVLCSEALDAARDLIKTISMKVKDSESPTEISDKVFIAFSYSDSYIRFYQEALRCLKTLNQKNLSLWLHHLFSLPIDLRDKWKLILSGLFLQTNDLEISKLTCNILVGISYEIKSFGSHVLCLVLHKLTKSRNSEKSKYLLLAIPDLITTKENIPIVTHTLDTLLNGEKQLKYFAIELYLKALKKEPRCYRFVSTAIIRMMKNDRSWYSDATCAKAMRYICENHPEHGEKLVPLLSETLNRCVDTNGGTASALALKSISALCKYSVTHVPSTWQVLAPKMEREKRTIVLESLCEFFEDIPLCPSQYTEDEYEKLMRDVMTNLWKYACCDDVRVIESAFKALSSYRLEQIPLKSLPTEFRYNLTVPPSYLKTVNDAEKRPEDVLPYVPGSCWIQMLQKVSKAALNSAGNLLISFIKEEVCGFRSKIYVWPHGEPGNFKYLPEKSVIRAVGEYLRRSDKSNSSNHRVITECLRIFSHRYPKPLPNVNWAFLDQTADISNEAKEYSLLIGCHLSTVSLSAKTFVESYLAKYKCTTDPILQSNEPLILYSCLEDLCQSISSSSLKGFFEVTLDSIVEKINLDNDDSTTMFECIMSAYARALKKPEIHDSNCTLISNLLEKLFDKIDLTLDRFKPYLAPVLELPTKDLERMTSPKIWLEITPEKLKNAITVKSALVVRKRNETPLTCLNESIDVAAFIPSVQAYVMEVIQKVYSELRFEKLSANWILDVMSYIEGLVVETCEENVSKADFYCNVLFISIICMSGMDSMLTDTKSLITSRSVKARLFPQAIAILTDRQDWKYTIPQIMEWLHYMRTSSISEIYKHAFHASLICLRHHPYYRDVWTNYLSIKTGIDI